jgi:hypothetical protein
MRPEFMPAIEALERDLQEQQRKVVETKRTINRLCEVAGGQPRYADLEEQSSPGITSIKADTFYGKVLHTAAREYLEMRRVASIGPASPREIFEALRKGGYQFDTKDDTTAMVGLRAVLRKNSSIFHKLPNGQYGLLSWYPNAKLRRSTVNNKPDEAEDDSDRDIDEVESESASDSSQDDDAAQDANA